jgi:hypothetical protein
MHICKRHDGGFGWRPGDHAECIMHDNWTLSEAKERAITPQCGGTYRVAGVAEREMPCGCIIVYLSFGPADRTWFVAQGFARITPRPDRAEAADMEFIAILPRGTGSGYRPNAC